MFTKPDGLSDAQVADAVRAAWGVPVDRIEWAPVGFGSHHWQITAGGDRWFATADDLDVKRRHASDPRRRLVAALTTARSLRDAGLTFVVAPLPTAGGEVLHHIDDRFALALYPNIEGDPHAWSPYPTRGERLAVLDLVATLHRTPASVTGAALSDDFAIPGRAELLAALADREAPWTCGPFAEPARALLRRHAPAVHRLLDRYDHLAVTVRDRGADWVITHGEPHRANTITTAEGPVLIDWETALLAPPERDLWAMADEDPRIPHDYQERTGTPVDAEALALYALWWDLTEVCVYTAALRQPHRDTEDTRLMWSGLEGYLTSRAATG